MIDIKSSLPSSPLLPSSLPHSLIALYESWAGCSPDMAVRLLGAGSDRIYWRLSSPGKSAVGVIADNEAEARAFVDLARCFHANGIAVPEIYGECWNPNECVYLQQDLGDNDLLSLLSSPDAESLLEKSMISLSRMQTLPAVEWERRVAFPPLSERQVMWDLNYFKYAYLKPAGISFSEDRLEDDFSSLCAAVVSIPSECNGFMMRDCQSRNVMVSDGTPYWIDFQGGRRGPALYDAVSFIYQARAGFTADIRKRLLEVYSDSFCKLRTVDREVFLSALPVLRLFRALQVMGAYGFRGLVQHRSHFIVSIPQALANLSELVEEGAVDGYPELMRVIRTLIDDSRFRMPEAKGLEVKVYSFSYKKGYPDDFTGNGGGFMFDCRALPNPGRYDEYKQLTGLDLPVIDFLKKYKEIDDYISHVKALVGPAVKRYLERGFTSLQVGFGCTGGQHRSVYCAETVSAWLAAEYPDARVSVCHRERGVASVKSEGKGVRK